jgi:hypothetical protein
LICRASSSARNGGRSLERDYVHDDEIHVEWQLREIRSTFHRLPPKDDSYRSPNWEPCLPVSFSGSRALARCDGLASPGLHDLGDVVIAEPQMLANERARNQPRSSLCLEPRLANLEDGRCLGSSIELIHHCHSAFAAWK